MNANLTVTSKPSYINGLNVQAAMDTIGAIQAEKSLARFQFRACNRWINGGENRSTIGRAPAPGSDHPAVHGCGPDQLVIWR